MEKIIKRHNKGGFMLNKSKGNMYDFITHTWNTVKGKCFHDCSYCYMKRWGGFNSVRFDEKELKTDLGKDNVIFVGSSNDLFSKDISDEWIEKTLNHCSKFQTNQYLFQTKNPDRIVKNKQVRLQLLKVKDSLINTTIETNRNYINIMKNSPNPTSRANAMRILSNYFVTYVTVEPIMDFDLNELVDLIKICHPVQVNIGADSGNNKLPEPSKEKILQLIEKLEGFTKVKQKKNLKRLLV